MERGSPPKSPLAQNLSALWWQATERGARFLVLIRWACSSGSWCHPLAMYSSPKRQRLQSPSGSPGSSQVVAGGSLASPSHILSQRSAGSTPGRSGDHLPEGVVDRWGACYKCKQTGHFARDCVLGSSDFTSKYEEACSLCHGEVKGMASCFQDVRGRRCVVHVACAVDSRMLELEQERRALHGPRLPAIAEGGGDEDPIAAITNCVEETDRNIGVDASAGSGKTHVVAVIARHVRDQRGERLIALTLNRDAAGELRERGIAEALTYHSLGARAWFRAHKRGCLVTEPEDEEGAAEASARAEDEQADEADEAAGRADEAAVQESYVPNKTKLLLRQLYPKPPEERGRGTLSLETSLFEAFVVQMVSLGKMEAVGVLGSPWTDRLETWVELCSQHRLDALIEGTLEKKLSDSRKAAAKRKWPTAISRRTQDHPAIRM